MEHSTILAIYAPAPELRGRGFCAMSFGIQTNYGPKIEQRETELRELSYLDKAALHGGIKLKEGTPQPRLDNQERPPELKSIQERAPYIANGKLIDQRMFNAEPKMPL